MEEPLGTSGGPVRLLAITSGGPRMHALKSQFERDETVWSIDVAEKAFGSGCDSVLDGFVLEYIQAVPGEACRSRKRLEALVGDVLTGIGLSGDELDEMGILCQKMRPGNRRVLGCLFANIRAMQRAVEISTPVLIIEDNVRALLSEAAVKAEACLSAAKNQETDLLYLGHLGHNDTMEIIAQSRQHDDFLVTPPTSQEVGTNHELWGTFAYLISHRLLNAVLAAIRTDFPRKLFIERRRDVVVTPIDKLLQRVARDSNMSIKVLRHPLFFRMPPVLPSKIHTKYDAPFLESTSRQLALYGLSWNHIWLTPAERGLVSPSFTSQSPEEEEVSKQAS